MNREVVNREVVNRTYETDGAYASHPQRRFTIYDSRFTIHDFTVAES